jgi:hydroxyacylglutathione hydrolase
MVIWQDDERRVHRLVLNEIKTNCYLVQRGRQALLVDPTDQPEVILAYLREQGLSLVAMLATHGHFDHVAAAAALIASGAVDNLALHPLELAEYQRANRYAMLLFKRRITPAAVAPFSAALLALLADWGLCLVHAGGHTRGSCYLHDRGGRFIITGDLALHHRLNTTLFDSRENLVEFAAFVESVAQTFAGDAVILPGHGDRSSVADELAHNRKWHYVRQKLAA